MSLMWELDRNPDMRTKCPHKNISLPPQVRFVRLPRRTAVWRMITFQPLSKLCPRCCVRAPLKKRNAYNLLTAYVCPCCGAEGESDNRRDDLRVWEEGRTWA